MKYKMVYFITLLVFTSSIHAKYWVCEQTLQGERTSAGFKMGKAVSFPFYAENDIRSLEISKSFRYEVESLVPYKWDIARTAYCHSYNSRRGARDKMNKIISYSRRKRRATFKIDFYY